MPASVAEDGARRKISLWDSYWLYCFKKSSRYELNNNQPLSKRILQGMQLTQDLGGFCIAGSGCCALGVRTGIFGARASKTWNSQICVYLLQCSHLTLDHRDSSIQ